jgi:hypothetical protein
MFKILFIGSLFLSFSSYAKPEKFAECFFIIVFTKLTDENSWKVQRCSHKGKENFIVDFAKGKKDYEAYEFIIKDASPIVDISYDLLTPDVLNIDFVHERGGEAYLISPLVSKKVSGFRFKYKGSEESSLELKSDGEIIEGKTDAEMFSFVISKTGEIVKDLPLKSARCDLKEKNKDKKKSYELIVHKKGDEIVGVTYKGSSESGKIAGAYFCDFHMSNKVPHAKFQKEGQVTTIKFKDLNKSSVIKITEEKTGFTTEFKDISQITYCGAGAKIPSKITLKNKKCKIEQDD